MAWIEAREQHRVYWSNDPGMQPRRDCAADASRADAELFIRLISAPAGDPVAAARRNATIAPTA